MTPTPETLRVAFHQLANLPPGFGPLQMGPILDGIRAAADAWEATVRENEARTNALRWLVNLCCGVGKSGDKPTDGEFVDAIEAGKAALKEAP